MRILFIVHSYPPKVGGGVELLTYYLAKYLKKEHEVFVLCPKKGGGLNSGLHIQYSHEGVGVVEISTGDGVEDIRSHTEDPSLEEAFREILDDIAPDVIHIQHALGLPASLMGVAREIGSRLILGLHDYWYMCPRVQLMYRGKEPCKGPRPFKCMTCLSPTTNSKDFKAHHEWLFRIRACLRLPVPSGRQTGVLHRQARIPLSLIGDDRVRLFDELRLRESRMKGFLNGVDGIICPSSHILKRYVEWGIKGGNFTVIPNPVPEWMLEYNPALSKKVRGQITFGYIGSIAHHKGLSLLIKSFITLRGDGRLCIFGDKGYSRDTERYFQQLEGINHPGVNFYGGLPHSRIKRAFDMIDVLVVPSLWEETYATVIEEAKAFRIPIIASNTGGIPEHLEGGIEGVLVEPGDVEGFRKAMGTFIERPELLSRFQRGLRHPLSYTDYLNSLKKIYGSETGYA